MAVLSIGLTVSCNNQLQAVLIVTACLVGGIPRFGLRSTFLWEELHWLSIKNRIKFQILTLMCNCLADCAPSYLRKLYDLVSSKPISQSCVYGNLVVPRASTVQHWSFTVTSPSFWNKLQNTNSWFWLWTLYCLHINFKFIMNFKLKTLQLSFFIVARLWHRQLRICNNQWRCY